MAIYVVVDDRLVAEALKVGNHKSKREAVTAALREYINARKRLELLKWVGKVDYDYDYKKSRKRRTA